MATVPIVFDGVVYPKTKTAGDKPKPVTFVGNAWIQGLTPGLPLPEVPPSSGGQPGEPGTPQFPIWGPPGSSFPGTPGYPPVAGHPLPEPPEPVSPENPKPIEGWEAKAAWSPVTGWIVVLVPDESTLVPTPSQRREGGGESGN